MVSVGSKRSRMGSQLLSAQQSGVDGKKMTEAEKAEAAQALDMVEDEQSNAEEDGSEEPLIEITLPESMEDLQ